MSPWLLDGAVTASIVSGLIIGVALVVLSFPRGKLRERYGIWDRYIV